MHAPIFKSSADETEVAYYDALCRSDIDALMALWAEDEEIVCIHPNSPRLVGHAHIRASFESIFERGIVQIRPIQVHAVRNMMAEVHNIVEEVQRAPELPHDIHILCTNIYIKTPRGWRITLHHASVAPGPTPRELFRATMLH
jgi:ketosteroid isomerase-like protein